MELYLSVPQKLYAAVLTTLMLLRAGGIRGFEGKLGKNIGVKQLMLTMCASLKPYSVMGRELQCWLKAQ